MTNEKVKTEAAGSGSEQIDQGMLGFLSEYAGAGTANIKREDVTARAFLTITDAKSEAVTLGKAQPGVFYHTGLDKSYGTKVSVIIVGFDTVWDEKDPETKKTLNRFRPHTIPVKAQPVPAGKRGFPKLIAESGNEILETFAYALLMADDMEAGLTFYTAGAGGMSACRKWNSKWLNQWVEVPNAEYDASKPEGDNNRKTKMVQAAIFAKKWGLTITSKISSATNRPYFTIGDVVDEGWINPADFKRAILPAFQAGQVKLIESVPVEASADADA